MHYLAKDGHFKNFFLRMFMNLTGQIETHRKLVAMKPLASAADVLASNSVWVFFLKELDQRKLKNHFYLVKPVLQDLPRRSHMRK